MRSQMDRRDYFIAAALSGFAQVDTESYRLADKKLADDYALAAVIWADSVMEVLKDEEHDD